MSETVRSAFLAGYAPPAAGLYFNGLELLAQADRGASLDLARQIGEERERVVAKRDEALARVAEAAAAQQRLGVEPVPGPEDSAAFEAWAEAVFERVSSAVGEGTPQAVAHLLGFVLGEAMATLDVIAILSRLRELAPDHLWMHLQADSLERERQTAERRLGRLASHELLPGDVQTATALAAHLVAEAAPSGSFSGRATRAETAAASLAGHATTIELAL